jgi:SAM-dependent methyltransferase
MHPKNKLHLLRMFLIKSPLYFFLNIYKQIAQHFIDKAISRSLTPIPLKFNRILDDKAREEYEDVISCMHRLTPKMMKRKIARANVQQAFVLHMVRHFYRSGARVLCVGSHEDTAWDSLRNLGVFMEEIDPVKNYDLSTFYHLPTTKKAHYDIVFSTSVIEHVEDDDIFLAQIQDLLVPGGIGILTCDYKDDYKNGDYIFPGNYRFYTQELLREKLKRMLSQCELLDAPNWDCPNPDFFFEGQTYTFATLVFRKTASG